LHEQENPNTQVAEYADVTLGITKVEEDTKEGQDIPFELEVLKDLQIPHKVKISVADAIVGTINTSLNKGITGKELIEIFHSGILPSEKAEYIRILFSEIPPAQLARFLNENNISFEEVRMIYETTQEFHHNILMEIFLYGDMGKTS
jgi:hypothetical protein